MWEDKADKVKIVNTSLQYSLQFNVEPERTRVRRNNAS